MTKLLTSFVDYTAEESTGALYVDSAISDANITAIVTAIDGITVDGRQQAVLSQDLPKDAGITGKATSPLAQREVKWYLRYTDDVTGDKGGAEYPCADLSLLSGGTDFLDLSAGAGAALKTAVDTYGRSRLGNAITLQSVQFVGRNL